MCAAEELLPVLRAVTRSNSIHSIVLDSFSRMMVVLLD